MAEGSTPEIGADDFSRRFAMRAPTLMWFLGAGASASAGIPTAGDMIWEFKQRLFVSQRRVSPKSVADLSSPIVRQQLQEHIDARGEMPQAGSAGEYAGLFEVVYPAESDRRAFLDAKVAGAKPSLGHIALASFMRGNQCRIIWTTNFDPLVADACARVYDSTGPLTSVNLDAPDLASQAITEGRWPVEIKLHGDFRSRRLKNTSEELRYQDQRLRQVLMSSCSRFGLIVAGYSGRDESILDTFDAVLDHPEAFPAGLFWLTRQGEELYPRVERLLQRAHATGVECALVRISSFDEAVRDLVRMSPTLDTSAVDAFGRGRQRWTPAPQQSGRRGWPVMRFNAIPVTRMPSVCRRVVCSVGGTAEVRGAIEAAGVDVLAVRTRSGVLAFGSDTAVRSAFSTYGVDEFDLHTLDTRKLRFDSGERGLLRDALTSALQRERGLTIVRRSVNHLLAPANTDQATWATLKRVAGVLRGSVPGHPGITWKEGLGVRLEWASDQLWLVFEPRTVFDGVTDATKTVAADFARERAVRRYNRTLNDLIGFWSDHLAGDGEEIRAIGMSDGVDAVFALSKDNGFSRRGGA